MAMRSFFFLLVFANLLFFAWAQGYFGAADENREPERLNQQLQADKLRIVRDTAASASASASAAAPKAADLACRIINGLAMANAEALKSAVQGVGGEAKILPASEQQQQFLVVITELANQAAAEKKAAELVRFGVSQQTSVPLDGGRYEIVLGRFPAETAAREFLQGLTKRGIKSARVEAREQPALKASVEARAPAAILLQQLPLLIAPYADATLAECGK
ncbi:MAG: hypothetical protein NDI67_14095 [Sulfuritalea sp.]|nr:hypothetical protein [Sulfuritalea sp.]